MRPQVVTNEPLSPTQWQRPTTETPPQQMPTPGTTFDTTQQVGTRDNLSVAIATNNVGVGEAHKQGHVQACPSCGDTTFLSGMPNDAMNAGVMNTTTGVRALPGGRCVKCGFSQVYGAHTVPNLPTG
jgi:predicted nucleic-acid-binding Zn-ribbon protein